jgi:hypothetical protein
MSIRLSLLLLLGITYSCPAIAVAQQGEKWTIQVLTTDGEQVIGVVQDKELELENEMQYTVDWGSVYSYHSAQPPSEHEQRQIDEAFPLLDSKKVVEAERAAATLGRIGLPVMTQLLQSFTDDDGIQPGYRYRLYERMVPGPVDAMARDQGLLRTVEGDDSLRANLTGDELTLAASAPASQHKYVKIPMDKIRSIGVLRPSITRQLKLEARQHVTYVEWLDTGIDLTPESSLEIEAEGLVRLSFDEDGWACDPDGIHDPLPGKRRLQQGFRWGSVLGRVGPEGEKWLVGKHAEKADLPAGRLYLAINENERWQNNIGSFRVTLKAKQAFDMGEAH